VPGSDHGIPPIGTLIHVFLEGPASAEADGAAESLRSRIEDIIPRASPKERDHIMIAAPVYAGDIEPPREGTRCGVVWPTSREMRELPTAFVHDDLAPILRVWHLEVLGPPARVQRRNYSRVPMELPVEVVGEQVESHAGHTVDVSEGGLLCALNLPPLDAGETVRVNLKVADTQLSITAKVIRTFDTKERDGKKVAVTAVRFENPDEYGDVVRHAVFAEQMKIRKKGLESDE
jgi:hypothetical protein